MSNINKSLNEQKLEYLEETKDPTFRDFWPTIIINDDKNKEGEA